MIQVKQIKDENWLENNNFPGAKRFPNGDWPLYAEFGLSVEFGPDRKAIIIIDAIGAEIRVWFHGDDQDYMRYEYPQSLPNAEYAKGLFHFILANNDLRAHDIGGFGFLTSGETE